MSYNSNEFILTIPNKLAIDGGLTRIQGVSCADLLFICFYIF